MSLTFTYIEPKLGTVQPGSDGARTMTLDHTYLEVLLGDRLSADSPPTLYVGKLHDGVNPKDLEDLRGKGFHLIAASGKTAYFADADTAAQISDQVFADTYSDAVAYGSILLSSAKTSTQQSARVLVIDDESNPRDWGSQPILDVTGNPAAPELLQQAASVLGDSYGLIAPELHRELEGVANTPFQFRAGVSGWQGVVKGTCRASALCEQLGVSAIIPKSAIKGDGKTAPTGIHEVESLFWSRKADAATRMQRLGTQVIVNFPQALEQDILPKLQPEAQALAQAQSDPRKLATLYTKWYENSQRALAQLDRSGRSTPEAEPQSEAESNLMALLGDLQAEGMTTERMDWLYETLKADTCAEHQVRGVEPVYLQTLTQNYTPEAVESARTLFEQGLSPKMLLRELNQIHKEQEQSEQIRNTPEFKAAIAPYQQQQGGYGQLLENQAVVEGLQQFVRSYWKDIATGGVEVPSALAQPHPQLQRGEVCFPALPHGAQVMAFRSPVVNTGNFTILSNNLSLQTSDPEAFAQQGAVYLNPDDAKQYVIDFDGDAPALIPAEEIVPGCPVPQSLKTLQPDQVCIPTLPEGMQVTLYHSRDQTTTLTNSYRGLSQERMQDAEDTTLYLPPDLLKSLDASDPIAYGYADGTHGFATMHRELQQLNVQYPPVQVEKEKKIVRDASHTSIKSLPEADRIHAERFTSIESAALDVARTSDQVGIIANQSMRLQAIRWDLAEGIDRSVVTAEFEERWSQQAQTTGAAGKDDAQAQFLLDRECQLKQQKLTKLQSQFEGLQGKIDVPPSTDGGYDFAQAMERIIAQGASTEDRLSDTIEGLESVAPDKQEGTIRQIASGLKRTNWRKQISQISELPESVQQTVIKGLSAVEGAPDALASKKTPQERQAAVQKHLTVYGAVTRYLQDQLQAPNAQQEALKAAAALVVKPAPPMEVANTPERLERLNGQIETTLEFLHQVEGLNAKNLQRAVDAFKSARPVDTQITDFCEQIGKLKPIEWINEKGDRDGLLYLNRPMGNNSQDPVGKLIEMTNQHYNDSASQISFSTGKYHQALFSGVEYSPEQQEETKAIAAEYNQTMGQLNQQDQIAKTNEGVRLQLTSQLGNAVEITNLIKFDPQGTSPVWDLIRAGEPFDVTIVPNGKTNNYGWQPTPTQQELDGIEGVGKSRARSTGHTHDYRAQIQVEVEGKTLKYDIGTLSQASHAKLAERVLKQESPADYNEIQAMRCSPKWQDLSSRREMQRGIDLRLNQVDVAKPLKALSPQLLPPHDREQIKQEKIQANRQAQAWQQSIDSESRPAYAAALWRDSQKLALKLFPEQVSDRLQSFQFTQSKVVGLDRPLVNEQHGKLTAQETTVPIRIALDDRSTLEQDNQPVANPHCNKRVIQIGVEKEGEMSWQTIAALEKDAYPLPVGAQAEATLQASYLEGKTKRFTETGQGQPLSIQVTNSALYNQLDISKFNSVQFVKDQRKVLVQVEAETGKQTLGSLVQKSADYLRQQETQHNLKIIDNPSYQVPLSLHPKVAIVEIDPATVQPPQQWNDLKLSQIPQVLPAQPIQAVAHIEAITPEVELPQVEPVQVTPVNPVASIPVAPFQVESSKPILRLVAVAEPKQPQASPVLKADDQKTGSQISDRYQTLGSTPKSR